MHIFGTKVSKHQGRFLHGAVGEFLRPSPFFSRNSLNIWAVTGVHYERISKQ